MSTSAIFCFCKVLALFADALAHQFLSIYCALSTNWTAQAASSNAGCSFSIYCFEPWHDQAGTWPPEAGALPWPERLPLAFPPRPAWHRPHYFCPALLAWPSRMTVANICSSRLRVFLLLSFTSRLLCFMDFRLSTLPYVLVTNDKALCRIFLDWDGPGFFKNCGGNHVWICLTSSAKLFWPVAKLGHR